MREHDNYEQEGWSIENSINASCPFEYPTEFNLIERYYDVGTTEVIVRISTIIFSSNKPKVALACLLYAAGIDVGIYLNCENTITEIGKVLGESKQNMSCMIKKFKKEFKLKSNTGKMETTKSIYEKSNYRKRKSSE